MTEFIHKIIELNPSFVSKDGVWSPPRDVKEIKVEFTNAAQERVLALISSFDDSSSDSEEVDVLQGNGEYVNVRTAQFLHAFDLSKVNTALEVSADFGNLSRLLGEKVTQVESVRCNKNTAIGNAYRCADMANVATICAPLDSLELPEKHYDFILVSQLEQCLTGEQNAELILKSLLCCLKPGGVLAVITANPKPLSAWFSNDGKLPYSGLYASPTHTQAHLQWVNIIKDSGLTEQTHHCFLPNAKNGKTLLAKQYVNESAGAINHFYGAGLCSDEKLNEYLLFTELSKHSALFDLCDDYLTLASSEASSVLELYNNDFTHFSSVGRQQRWRTMTTKGAAAPEVEKHAIGQYPSEKRSVSTTTDIVIEQDLAPQTYQLGQSLAGAWLESLVVANSIEEFEQLLTDYYAWLQVHSSEFGGALYDLLPFNLIIDSSGQYQAIDPEWRIEEAASYQFVMFRALFWFGFHNRHLLSELAATHGLFSIGDFVQYGLKHVGCKSDMDYFGMVETEIQSAIEKQFNKDAIAQTMRLPIALDRPDKLLPLLPSTQLFWYESHDLIDFENSVSVAIDTVDQTLELTTLVAGFDTAQRILRVDPIDRGGYFKFCSITLLDSEGARLWSIDDQASINQTALVENAIYCGDGESAVYLAQNEDPRFIFDLSDVEGRENAHSVQLSISYSHGTEYNLAMQELGQESMLQKEFISQQRNELETLRARYSQLNDNFVVLKKSSEDQHALIEHLTEQTVVHEDRVEVLNTQIVDQQEVIESQLEMMQRTRMARFKNMIARIGSPEPEVEIEPEPEPEPIEVNIKPHELGQNNEDYELWIEEQSLSLAEQQRIRDEIEAMPLKPTFSIVVPVYDIDEEYLMLAINSVRNQLYPYWELCLVDDASPSAHVRPMLKRLTILDSRIVVRLNKQNQGIAGASNDAVQMTTGDYVALLDHDDEISIDALYENAKVINESPDVGFIYSDEDKVTMDERRVDPFFKPDYSPDLLDSQNYICHFSVISQKIVEKIGGFRLGFDGSQDHDIIIRAIEHAEQVVHIPKVLYHWRKVPGSTAEVYDAKSYAWEAGRKAVEARLEQSGDLGRVELGPLKGTYQVIREIVGHPKVSIIIPFKDKPELLKTCIDSILKCNSYLNFEVVGVSNSSEEPETHELMRHYQEEHEQVRFVEKNVPFNFSEICNYGVAQSDGDYVLLLNNDIEVRSEDWLERLLEHAQRKEIGAVGGKLFFPDGRIQHAGVVAGMHGAAGHSAQYFAADDIGYYGSLMVTRNVSAVTGAMLMVSREKYLEVGGLDEENLAVAYNDVDFCLKLLDAGYRNIFTPFVHAVHAESASRGYEDNPEKIARLEKERDYFLGRWQVLLDHGDTYFNPNFDLDHFDFSIKIESDLFG